MTVGVEASRSGRLGGVLREGGPVALVRYIAGRMQRRMMRRAHFITVAKPLAEFKPRYLVRRKACDIEVVKAGDLARFDDPYSMEYRHHFERWLARGDVLIFAIKDGAVHGFSSLLLQDYRGEEGFVIPVRDDEALLLGLEVFPPYRRGALAGVLQEAALQEAKDRGYVRVTGGIGIWNRDSINTARHMGYHQTGQVVATRVLGITLPQRDLPPLDAWPGQERRPGRGTSAEPEQATGAGRAS